MNSCILPRLAALALVVARINSLAAAEPRVLIPTAPVGSATWRYTTENPGDRWTQPDFDDGKWARGQAGFGVTDQVTPPNTVGTPWKTSAIWLRTTIDVPGPLQFTSAGMIVRHDEDVDVYVNGTAVFSAHGFNTQWTAYDVTKKLRAALKLGKNLVAVHVTQSSGGQYIDVGLVLDPKQKLVVPVKSIDPLALQELRDARWSEEKAWAWYAEVGPIAGCNYLPRTAVNMTEMWQKETFDPKTIDEELGWAEKAGYNSLRVFVQYLVWKHDAEGLKQRMDEFLAIADRHGIRVMFVPFCDCAFAGREPYLGKQDEPVPGVHNSGWVPSPGLKRVVDRMAWTSVEQYTKDIVGRFGNDRRVLIWDLYNEPGQSGLGEKSLPLVAAAFSWAREANAAQPLTVGAWTNFESRMSKAMMEMSDVVSFHGYDTPEGVARKSRICRQYHRPVICTEWLHRGANNTFETILPIFARDQIGGYHWGLVAGRTQTYMPWGSKKGDPMPKIWHHDVIRPDGAPYDAKEFELLREFRENLHRRPIEQGRGSQHDGTTVPTARPSTYRGWQAYVLENELVRLHVVPDIGGRVIQYALGEKEFFWVNPTLAGKTSPQTGLDPDGGWLNYGGDKLWPAPQGWDNEGQWPGPPDAVLDGQPYRVEADLDRASIRVTSGDDLRSGIRFTRRIRLHPQSTRVSVEATMTNVDDKPRRWGIWAHTQLDAGLPGSDDYNRLMCAWCPINPRSQFDPGYRVIFGEKDNPSFEVDAKRGLMKVSYRYIVGKIGLDSHAGWVATVDGRQGDVFVQRFTFDPERAYPDGSSVEFWHNGLGRIYAYDKWIEMPENRVETPYVFESEVLSPLARLQPGESSTWRYEWNVCRIGGDFPVVTCSDAGLVSQPLASGREDDRVHLSGRFGVFHQGRLILEVHDARDRILATEILDRDATPLMPIVLDRAIAVPTAAHYVAIVLENTEGKRIGEVARAELTEKPR